MKQDSPIEVAGSPNHATTARVTVVIQSHNRPELLDVAVNSIFLQTCNEWELVIVDDASTPAISENRWPDYAGRIRLLRNQVSIGGAGAKTYGVSAVTTDFIAFLDDDDLYDRNFLKDMLGAFDRNPDLDVIFSGVRWFGKNAAKSECGHELAVNRILNSTDAIEKEPHLWVFDKRLVEALLREVPMPFQRPFARIVAMNIIGLYRPECLLWDNDWALRAALIAKCALLNKPNYCQRDDEQGYHSRHDRLLAQMQSALEITLHLYRRPPVQATPQDISLLRSAASSNAFSVAYFYSHQGDFLTAMQYWLLSQRLKLTLGTFKFPIGAAARSLSQRIIRGQR